MATNLLSLRVLLRRFLGSAVSNSAGYAVGGAVLPTLEPLTQDLANVTWALHRVKPLPLNAAAVAALRGYWTDEQAAQEAGYTGYDGGRFDLAQRLAGTTPPLESLLDLRRRGVIADAGLVEGLQQSGMLPGWRDRFRELLHVLPSVTDMVRFAVREVYDPGQRAALQLDAELPGAFLADAERIGLSPEEAGKYWASHWELPSYEQGVQMLFRGAISQAQFDGLLKALDYAPVWRPRLLQIARRIPPLDDMIRFAVREVYDPRAVAELGLDTDFPTAFATDAALHGMDAERARHYWRAHWRLPSAQQGSRMLWRGEITEPQLDGLLKALDYPPLWRERLANIARIVPGRIDLKRMLRHEVLTRAEVKAGYRRLGYAEPDAEAMTQIAEAEVGAGDAASTWLGRARSRLYTVAHNEYLDGSIGEAQAATLLGRIGAPQNERAAIVSLWDAENEVSRLELTPAQLKRAAKVGPPDGLTRDDALQRLIDKGMSADDAEVFLGT
jgi:hypothetical protein